MGDYRNDLGAFLPLILHWDGSAWTQAASPLTSGTSVLDAVSARSATSAWAVGETYNTTAKAYQALILHWDGTAWTEQRSHVPSGSGVTSYLEGVTATSARNAWAVGYYVPSPSGTLQSLILHWNGMRWTEVPTPGLLFPELLGVTATSKTNAWAVGRYEASGSEHILIEHWDGTAWTQVPGMDPGAPYETLSGVAASSAGNVWAVGYYAPAGTGPEKRTLVEHWNGTAWTKKPSPNPGGTGTANVLTGVAAHYANAGAVGYYINGTGYPLAVHL